MKKVRVVSFAHDTPTGPLLNPYQYYQNMFKGYRSYRALKDASTDFCFKGDNNIIKKVRVVSFTRDMPTGPPLHPYQILSNYLKQFGSYGLHKNLTLGEINTLRR